MDAFTDLTKLGVTPIRLYKLYKRADEAMQRIDDFKKKLFVDKRICDRIIAASKQPVVRQPVQDQQKIKQELQENIRKDVRNHE